MHESQPCIGVLMLAFRMSMIPFSASFNVAHALPRPTQDPVYKGREAFCNQQLPPGDVRGTVSEHWICPSQSCKTKDRHLVPSSFQAQSQLGYWIPSLQQSIIQELGKDLSCGKRRHLRWVPWEQTSWLRKRKTEI